MVGCGRATTCGLNTPVSSIVCGDLEIKLKRNKSGSLNQMLTEEIKQNSFENTEGLNFRIILGRKI